MPEKEAGTPKFRQYPNSYEAERYVLCCILIDGDVASELVSELTSDYFYTPSHVKIFNAMSTLYSHGTVINVITVNDQLVKSGQSDSDMLGYLAELAQITPGAVNYKDFVRIIHRDMVMRKLIRIGNDITNDAYTSDDVEASISKAEKLIYDLSSTGRSGTGLEHISKAGQRYIERLVKMSKDRNSVKGLRTYYDIFDKTTNGLQPSNFIILAARPSVGKTAFALNIVGNIIRNRKTETVIAMFCMEMAPEELFQRLLAINTDVTMSKMSDARLSEDEYNKLWDAHVEASECQIYFDSSSLETPGSIASKCRRLQASTPSKRLDLVIIDYLQLMSNDRDKMRSSSTRQTDVSDISRMLKVMAMELKCPVIALSQMSRSIESREDKSPMLSDLRESGAIEQDADIVMFLSRENENDKDNPESNVILELAKHRNGELKKIRYVWEGNHVRFVESADQNIGVFATTKVNKYPKKQSSGDGEPAGE